MKKNILLILYIFSFFINTNCFSEDIITLPKVSINAIKEKGKKYIVDEDGEVNVKGKFIKRVEVGKTSLSVLFHNKTSVKKKPSLSIKAYNTYGMRIGQVFINWLFDTVAPEEKRTATEKMYVTDFVQMFKFTELKVSTDFNKIAYIVIDSQDL